MSRDGRAAESVDRIPGGTEPYATIRCPQAAWAKLRETLELDADSSAFDPVLRREIRQALEQVEYARDPDALAQAARNVLEWAEHMCGWDAPCWERLRRAVTEMEPVSDGASSAAVALRRVYDILYLDVPA